MRLIPSSLVRTASDEAAIDRGCVYDQSAVDRVKFFFAKFLRHSKGEFAGTRFELLPWQEERIIAPLFGWKMPDGTRRFRKVGCAVPKKNGKSTLLSGLSLYMLCGDGEAGAEVYSAAGSKDQASIIFNEAVNMVDASPALSTRIELKRQGKEMRYGNCIYKALSSDVPTKEGLNTHCLLFDELHAQPDWRLWNTLEYSFAARRQPILFWISTAGIRDTTALWWQEWQYARQVQDGKQIDISYLPCVYETAENADWTSEDVWRAANPSYGITLHEREFREAVDKAKIIESKQNEFKRYRLNIPARQVTKWIPAEKWEACAKPFRAKPQSECIIGFDLSSTSDLTAAVELYRIGTKRFIVPTFWIPEGALTRRRRENRAAMDQWAGKYINVIPGDVIRYDVLRKWANERRQKMRVKEIGIDPWNATQLATDLQDDGFKVVYVRTGFASISAATKEFERAVLDRELVHPGHPVLDWCLENVTVEQDAGGNLKPSKQKSTEKIDGIVAAIIALARSMESSAGKKSVYEGRGVQHV